LAFIFFIDQFVCDNYSNPNVVRRASVGRGIRESGCRHWVDQMRNMLKDNDTDCLESVDFYSLKWFLMDCGFNYKELLYLYEMFADELTSLYCDEYANTQAESFSEKYC